MLDLGVTHIINTSEQDVRIDPTKFAKQGICYKGFICKVNSVLINTEGYEILYCRTCLGRTLLNILKSVQSL